MKRAAKHTRNPAETRRKLVAATRRLVLRRGFNAAGVDQICADAGVTKGAFFHHFKSKEDLGRAVLADWAAFGMGFYAAVRAVPSRYPLDHFHRFIDVMIGFAKTSAEPVACVVGMISQEMSAANPALREAAGAHLAEWTEFARTLLAEAKAAQPPRTDFDEEEMAWFLNSLWQGSMLVSKTRLDPGVIIRNLERARDYVDGLFGEPAAPRKAKASRKKFIPQQKQKP